MVVAPDAMRIGMLAERTSTTTHVLRAWENRYGLLQPTRTANGYRVYGPDDEVRVRAMIGLRERGYSAREAAAVVLDGERSGAGVPLAVTVDHPEGGRDGGTRRDPARLLGELTKALDRYDDASGQNALDRLLRAVPIEEAVDEILIPYLRLLGERWSRGEVSIAQEHFATNLIRRRLSTLALSWGAGSGPLAVLASTDRHDVALLCFGVVLRRIGWRIRYLGAETPIAAFAEASSTADLAVLAITLKGGRVGLAEQELLRDLAARTLVIMAGAAVTPRLADRVGAVHLQAPPGASARLANQEFRRRRQRV